MLRSVSSSDLDLLFGEDPMPAMARTTMSVLALTRETLATSTFRTAVMAERAGIFWSTATNLADEIVRATDLPFRVVHGVVGRAVRIAVEQGIAPEAVTTELLDQAAEVTIGRPLSLPEDFVRQAVDPWHGVLSLVTPGSAHPTAVVATIELAEQRQERHRDWYATTRKTIDDALRMLDRTVERYVRG